MKTYSKSQAAKYIGIPPYFLKHLKETGRLFPDSGFNRYSQETLDVYIRESDIRSHIDGLPKNKREMTKRAKASR